MRFFVLLSFLSGLAVGGGNEFEFDSWVQSEG
jgi:hypothetical protein